MKRKIGILVSLCLALALVAGVRAELAQVPPEPAVMEANLLPMELIRKAATANIFYEPNQNAMNVGAGVCINGTNLDGGVVCLYTITVDKAGNLAFYCNAAAGASCVSSLNGAMAAGTHPQFYCDGGLCPVFDGGY